MNHNKCMSYDESLTSLSTTIYMLKTFVGNFEKSYAKDEDISTEFQRLFNLLEYLLVHKCLF